MLLNMGPYNPPFVCPPCNSQRVYNQKCDENACNHPLPNLGLYHFKNTRLNITTYTRTISYKMCHMSEDVGGELQRSGPPVFLFSFPLWAERKLSWAELRQASVKSPAQGELSSSYACKTEQKPGPRATQWAFGRQRWLPNQGWVVLFT